MDPGSGSVVVGDGGVGPKERDEKMKIDRLHTVDNIGAIIHPPTPPPLPPTHAYTHI